MISRYLLEKDLNKPYFKNICQMLIDKYDKKALTQVTFGEVKPADKVIILTKDGPKIVRWGIDRLNGDGLILSVNNEFINNRKEFNSDIEKRKCVFLTQGFYLFNDGKHLVRNDENYMHLAGFYNANDQAVIIDKSSSERIVDLAQRIPAIIKVNEVKNWLRGKQISIAQEYLEVVKVKALD
ncbi:MAG: SOS response-associated peptidase family protein [Erysipelotrichaceae bacterium]